MNNSITGFFEISLAAFITLLSTYIFTDWELKLATLIGFILFGVIRTFDTYRSSKRDVARRKEEKRAAELLEEKRKEEKRAAELLEEKRKEEKERHEWARKEHLTRMRKLNGGDIV